MANPMKKGWKYLMSSFDHKIEENADPRVQIQQAVEGAKRQHQELVEQASEIIGNKSRLEMRMNRLMEEAARYQEQAKAAMAQADAATDPDTAREYNQAAEIIANQLVAAETQLEETKVQYQGAQQAVEQAKAQVKQSEARLKEQLGQANQLLAQAGQAAMQEQTTQAMGSLDGFSPDGSVPTLDGLQAKIEQRYATALGQSELQEETGAFDQSALAANDMKAASRLEEIRAQMNDKKSLEPGAED